MQESPYKYSQLVLRMTINLPCALMAPSKQHISSHWSRGDYSEILKMLFSKANFDANLINFRKKSCNCAYLGSQVNIGSGNGLVLSASKLLRNQIWPRSLSLYGATRPQWVNALKIRIDLLQTYRDTYGGTRSLFMLRLDWNRRLHCMKSHWNVFIMLFH